VACDVGSGGGDWCAMVRWEPIMRMPA
jgi:hypothetical protein